MKNKGRSHPDSNSNLRNATQIALAFGLLSLGWMMWDTREQTTTLQSLKPIPYNSTLSPQTIERINRHMQLTEKKGELRAMAMEAENFELGTRLKPGDFGTTELEPVPLGNVFESENIARKVYRDTENFSGYDNPVLPEDRVNAMLESDQWMQRYDKKRTDAFVKTVRDNARAAGYELEINDQLQVVKVRRLPNSVGGPEGAN